MAPQSGLIKVNWDAAIDISGKRMGMGIIARDHEGYVLASMCSIKQFIVDPAVAEAYAALKAVEFCCDLGLWNILLEGDALEIVNALLLDDPSWSRYGHLIDDTKLLLQRFCSWEVQHVKRGANMAAHSLAKGALRQSLEQIWLEDSPVFIHDIVCAEKVL
jgi:ribonuclease HI